jgi:hypothetical protein
VAGGFVSVDGGLPAANIARWNGVSWSSVGAGTSGAIHALTVFDDGSGPRLYVGGAFTSAGGISASRIARWDGASWSTVGSGMNDRVRAFTVFDDGGGPALYAGGDFTMAGGQARQRIAKLVAGDSWDPLGNGVDSVGSTPRVQALAAFDDGGGPALYAGGSFVSVDGVAASRIARWKDGEWSALGSGVSGTVYALASFGAASGTGATLFVGGDFVSAFESGDSHLARWQGCPDSMPPTLSCPEVVVKNDALTSESGEFVTFSVTATDNTDPGPSVISVPASGSFFPRGTTIVTSTATDALGNESVCTFPVVVQPATRKKRL